MRTIIESVAVSQQIDAEVLNCPRIEEAFDALKWWLSRCPESGELLDDYHWIYRQKGKPKLGIPALIVLYTFSPDNVEILAVLTRLLPQDNAS